MLRGRALAEDDAACLREGLPPPSELATALGEAWIRGEATADEVVAKLVQHHAAKS